MELRHQLNVIRHRLWLIVLLMALAGIGAYLYSSSLPKIYEARATLIVGQSLIAADVSSGELAASQRLSQTFAQLVTTTPVLQAVIDQLQLPMRPEQLRSAIVARTPRESTLLTIVVSDRDPQTAAALANAVAQRLIALSPAVQGQGANSGFIEAQLAATQRHIESVEANLETLLGLPSRTADQDAQIDALLARLVTLRQTYAQLATSSSGAATNLLTVVDPARPILEPAAPQVLLNTLLATLLGLVIALGLAFLLEYLDDTVKGPDDVTATMAAPTLGLISRMKISKKQPEHRRLVTLVAPRSSIAESYRTLRTNLEFASIDQPLRSLLVTSAVPREGKTTTSANVSIAFAQGGRRVILVDADMRRPGLHAVFELPNSHGLTTLLRAENADLRSIAHATDEPNLRVVTTGPLPPNPAELLGSQRMRDVLAQMAQHCDLIVVDSPPLQAVTDAAVLAAELGGTLLVVSAGKTRRAALQQAKSALDRVGANLLGVTLNRLSERSTAGYYYGYYGEYYGTGESGDGSRSTARPLEGRTGGSG